MIEPNSDKIDLKKALYTNFCRLSHLFCLFSNFPLFPSYNKVVLWQKRGISKLITFPNWVIRMNTYYWIAIQNLIYSYVWISFQICRRILVEIISFSNNWVLSVEFFPKAPSNAIQKCSSATALLVWEKFSHVSIPIVSASSFIAPSLLLLIFNCRNEVMQRSSFTVSSLFPATLSTSRVLEMLTRVLGSKMSFSPGGKFWQSIHNSLKLTNVCSPSTTTMALFVK